MIEHANPNLAGLVAPDPVDTARYASGRLALAGLGEYEAYIDLGGAKHHVRIWLDADSSAVAIRLDAEIDADNVAATPRITPADVYARTVPAGIAKVYVRADGADGYLNFEAW